ncbi:MAG: methyltransferase type 11 [Isosphaera sp.]|nr:methyltransferase type 11 [Isosphaera sp.]
MDVSREQARIDAVRWYHEFDFGNGLRARSVSDTEAHRRMWRFVEDCLAGVDFRGKTVLDIGCWDGYWSFHAERRGAAGVLAADDFTQNWAGADGLFLARELLGSKVETDTRRSVYDLAGIGRRFDVVLFLGVYYHLFDPFHALAQVRHCCHPGTVVCVEGNDGPNLPPDTALFDPENGGGKFLPSIGHLRRLLRAAYLSVAAEHVLEAPPPPPPPPPQGRVGWRWRLAMCRQVLAGSRPGIADLAGRVIPPPPPPPYEPLTASRRVFLTCTPFEGENPAHYYRPPFGLHAYDPRFRDEARAGERAA